MSNIIGYTEYSYVSYTTRPSTIIRACGLPAADSRDFSIFLAYSRSSEGIRDKWVPSSGGTTRNSSSGAQQVTPTRRGGVV